METKAEKIVTARQFDSGNVPPRIWDEIRKKNENPTFENKTKPYEFIEPIKTDTRNHGWLFKLDDSNHYFIALQHQIYGASECISIFKSDKKQNFNISETIKSYLSYVDIEYIVDKFVKEELKIEKEISEEK